MFLSRKWRRRFMTMTMMTEGCKSTKQWYFTYDREEINIKHERREKHQCEQMSINDCVWEGISKHHILQLYISLLFNRRKWLYQWPRLSTKVTYIYNIIPFETLTVSVKAIQAVSNIISIYVYIKTTLWQPTSICNNIVTNLTIIKQAKPLWLENKQYCELQTMTIGCFKWGVNIYLQVTEAMWT